MKLPIPHSSKHFVFFFFSDNHFIFFFFLRFIFRFSLYGIQWELTVKKGYLHVSRSYNSISTKVYDKYFSHGRIQLKFYGTFVIFAKMGPYGVGMSKRYSYILFSHICGRILSQINKRDVCRTMPIKAQAWLYLTGRRVLMVWHIYGLVDGCLFCSIILYMYLRIYDRLMQILAKWSFDVRKHLTVDLCMPFDKRAFRYTYICK